ncbi:MAG TPA: hypothetical protein VF167_02285 [Longimicrobiaceae bacterium]
MPQPLKIGLIVGAEASFPTAFMEEVNARAVDVTAELVRLGARKMDGAVPYAVIVDRMSHEVPFYRTYLKHAILHGCRVINNPFISSSDDKFFGASLAAMLGIRSPRTIMLPHKEYAPGLVHEQSLRNLEYPLDWQGVIDYVGLPCILKDAHGGGWQDVHLCHSLDELLLHYNESGRLLMIAQEYVAWERFVRCLCIGREEVLPFEYDPVERRFRAGAEPLPPELSAWLAAASRRLVRATGYDMNAVDWAVRGGVPYAVDLMNPVPELGEHQIGTAAFRWAISNLADLAIRLARKAPPDHATPGWARYPERLTGQSDPDRAGDLAEELPSLAQGLTKPKPLH